MDYCPRDATPLPLPIAATEFELAVGLSGRYRIVRRLGEGGMGTVFLAEQVHVGSRSVALKILRRKLLEDPEFLQRFKDEASSTGRIRHQNVVTVHECGQTDDGSPYIAMEYLEGESLRQTLQRRGALPLNETAAILHQAARGLNAAHRLGIIHRDLKPDNIFLTRDDEDQPLVKIVDFGIAKMRESATHTLTGMAIGTPRYMSVEQAAGMRSSEIDGRSDIYSLGIVVYEMVTGRLPFQADTPMAYFGKHLVEPPQPFQLARPDLTISPQVEEAVMKALKKKREQRYPTVPEFAREFSQAVSTAVAPADVAPQAPPPARRSRKMMAVAAVLVFCAGVAAVSWFASGSKTGPKIVAPITQDQPAVKTAPPSVVANSTEASGPSVGNDVGRRRHPDLKEKSIGKTMPPPVRFSVNTPKPQQDTPTIPKPPDATPDSANQIKAATALGDLLYNRGEYDDAVAEYRKGLDAAPGNAVLLARIERAQRAKAAEQRINQ
jgi:serine/threonine protein kinase